MTISELIKNVNVPVNLQVYDNGLLRFNGSKYYVPDSLLDEVVASGYPAKKKGIYIVNLEAGYMGLKVKND